MQTLIRYLIDFFVAVLILCIMIGVLEFAFGFLSKSVFSTSSQEVSSGLPQPASSPSGE